MYSSLRTLIFKQFALCVAAWLLTEMAAVAQAPQPGQGPPHAPPAAAEQPATEKPVAPAEADENAQDGQFITIPSPITDRVDRRVRRLVQDAIAHAARKGQRLTLVFEIQPGKDELGKALDLAKYLSGPNLEGARTVAYITKPLEGHGVLLALACDEIVMAEEATIGKAGRDEPAITADVRSAYEEIARRRRTIPEAVVLGMLEPTSAVLLVETENSREFVRAPDLEKLKETKAIVREEELFRAGEPGVLTAQQARQLGFVKLLAKDRLALLQAYSLPRDALTEDPTTDGNWRPARIDLKGPLLDGERLRQAQRIIKEAERNDRNFICIYIDSAGGSPEESMQLAGQLAALDSTKIMTVAYVPREARAEAALIALACDRVVAAPGAIMGGSGAVDLNQDAINQMVEGAKSIAQQKFRSPALLGAIFDPNLRVFRYLRKGASQFLTEHEFDQLPDKEEWRQDREVTEPGREFQFTGQRGYEEYDLVWELTDDFAGFKRLFGLEKDPTLLEPGWADTLVEALRSPNVAVFLMLIGMMAVWSEMQMPGVGLGWLVGGLCFLIFFWSNFLGGTAGWLEICLFLAGVCCLLLEFFVLPGLGLFGLAGGVLVLTSLILASQTFIIPHNDYQIWEMIKSISIIFFAGLGTMVFGLVARRFLPHTPMFNHLMLEPPTSQELAASEVSSPAMASSLVGQVGTAVTRLAPAGKVQLGDKFVDVTAEGEFVDRGALVTVIEARGNRIVVRGTERT